MKLQPYVVRAGDYLSKLAARFGFDPAEVWDDPKNAELKALRESPEVLEPGDIVHLPIPEQSEFEFDIAPGETAAFTGAIPMIKLRLVLSGDDGQPLAGKQYWIDGGTEPAGTTDGSGNVELEVPITTSQVLLSVDGCDSIYAFRVGHLDPINSSSGVRQRLVHLGFLADQSAGPGLVADAVRRFQEHQGLDVTGDVDDKTAGELKKAHGG